MNYQLLPIQEENPPRVVLASTLSLVRVMFLILRIAGIGLFVAAASLAIAGTLSRFFEAVLGCAGGGLCLLALSHLVRRSSRMPSRFVFDNQHAHLCLEGEPQGERTLRSQLPYRDIQGFQTRRLSLSQKVGREIVYIVEMVKQDGAFWALYSTPKRPDAEALQSALQRYVTLRQSDPTQTPDDNARSVGNIEILERPEHTILRWRVRSGRRQGVITLLLCLSALVGLYPLQELFFPAVWHTVLGVLGVIALWGLSTTLLHLQRFHTITITDTHLEYAPENPTFPFSPFSLVATDIETILFNFSLDAQESMLFLLQPGETGQLLKHKRGQDGFSKSNTLPRLLRNIHKIDTRELNFAEQLHLENALQDIIFKRCQHQPK